MHSFACFFAFAFAFAFAFPLNLSIAHFQLSGSIFLCDFRSYELGILFSPQTYPSNADLSFSCTNPPICSLSRRCGSWCCCLCPTTAVSSNPRSCTALKQLRIFDTRVTEEALTRFMGFETLCNPIQMRMVQLPGVVGVWC
jgi:hypothetical protein